MGGSIMASTINAKNTSTGVVITPDSSGQLELQTADTTRMTIDVNGNVGIGTSSPTQKLSVVANSAGTSVYTTIQNSNSASNSNAGFLFATSNSSNYGVIAQATDNFTYISNVSSGGFVFSANGSERMRIASNGSVNIGAVAQNTASKLQISGESSTSATNSLSCVNSSGTGQLFLRNDNYFNSGAIANYSVAGTALVIDGSNYVGKTTSSLRYKKDIVNYDKGLEAIDKLRPVYYKSAVEGPDGIDPKQHAGFIAEEIAEEGFEEFLIRNQDGEPDAIQYAQMTAILCKAIQELKAELDTVKAELAELKGAA